MWLTPLIYLPMMTYNSFRGQIGYCMMQSFDTVSRNTSLSVPMFMDGRISFGVGLSSRLDDSDHQPFPCGMCLNITRVHNFFLWNPELTSWIDEWPIDRPFLAMVFDQCTDPICTPHFLDIDIYNEIQPVHHGNPHEIYWQAIPCPIHSEEPLEYIICTAQSCHENDDYRDITVHPGLVDFWSVVIRNMRFPLKAVWANDIALLPESAWSYSGVPFNLSHPIYLRMVDYAENVFYEILDIPSHGIVSSAYRGGILLYGNQSSL